MVEADVVIASAPTKIIRLAVCRVRDIPAHPYCFGIVRQDTSTWYVTYGHYLGFGSCLYVIGVPEDYDFFSE